MTNMAMRLRFSLFLSVGVFLSFGVASHVNADSPETLERINTDASGTVISVVFNSPMADPSGNESAFDVEINGNSRDTVDTAVLNANDASEIDLTVHDNITVSQTVTLSYAPGTVTTASPDFQPIAGFTDQGVGNNVQPAPTVNNAATSDIHTIVLTMSLALTGTEGDPAAFTIAGAASNPRVTAVAVNGESVTLTTDNAITDADKSITVSYVPTGTDDLTNGLLVAAFTGQAVKNGLADFNDMADGNWNVGTTWGGACASSCVQGVDYPGPNNSAAINSHNVALTADQTAGTVSIVGGSFNTNSHRFTVIHDLIQTGGTVTANPAGAFIVDGSFNIPGPGAGGSFSRFTGSGTAGDPYIISDVYGLQAMNGFLSSDFKLANDIDASSTHNWSYNWSANPGIEREREGFLPVGGFYSDGDPSPSPFDGTFDGNDKSISGLYIDDSNDPYSAQYVGLFGLIDSPADIHDISVSYTINSFASDIGGLVGSQKGGAISDSSTKGLLFADQLGLGHGALTYDGGLVGYQIGGTISKSHSDGVIINGYSDFTGGLVGGNNGGGGADNFNITDSYSAVTLFLSVCADEDGGLVGGGSGSINNSYSTGHIFTSGIGCDPDSTPASRVGGLSGNPNAGSVSHSYTTSDITEESRDDIGGFFGDPSPLPSIASSYFTDASHNNGFGTLESKGASAFYGNSHPVYSAWDFNNVWNSFPSTYPHLKWENFSPPSASLPPVVTTGTTANAAGSSMTLTGALSSVNGQNALVEGFEYGTTSGAYFTSAINQGSFGASSFSTSTSVGIACGTTYYFRAFATNLAGTGYGNESTFTGCVSSPVLATPPATSPVPVISSGSSGGSVSIQALASILAPSPAATAYLDALARTVPGCPAGFTCTPIATTSPAVIARGAFSRDLALGSTGPDVTALQAYLNARGFALASSGPGSPGNETAFFGPLTKAALIKFQRANGITPAVGYFGPITRGYIEKP